MAQQAFVSDQPAVPVWIVECARRRIERIPLLAVAASTPLYGRRGLLIGFALTDGAVAGANGYLVNGEVNNADVLAGWGFGAKLGQAMSFGADGIPFDAGLYLVVSAGSVSGAIYVKF